MPPQIFLLPRYPPPTPEVSSFLIDEFSKWEDMGAAHWVKVPSTGKLLRLNMSKGPFRVSELPLPHKFAFILHSFAVFQNGKYRAIINGKPVNLYLEHIPFRQKYLQDFKEMVEQDDWFSRIDVRKMYLHGRLGEKLRSKSYALVYEKNQRWARILALNKQGKNRLGKFWDGLAPDTIANDSIWFLKLAGIDTSIFKAHSVRGAAASKALRAGAPMVDIMSRARWSNERTFRKHYGGALAEAALKSDLEEALRSTKFKQKKRKNSASKPKLPKPKKQKTKKKKSRKSGIRPTGQRLVGSRCIAWFPYEDGIGMWQGEVTKFDRATRKYDFLFEDGETYKWNAADVLRMERARPAQLEWCANNDWMN